MVARALREDGDDGSVSRNSTGGRVSFLNLQVVEPGEEADGGGEQGSGSGEASVGADWASSSRKGETSPSSVASSPDAMTRRRSRRASFLHPCDSGLSHSFYDKEVIQSWDFDFTASSVEEMVRG